MIHVVLVYFELQSAVERGQRRRPAGPHGPSHPHAVGEVLVGIVPPVSGFATQRFVSGATVPGRGAARCLFVSLRQLWKSILIYTNVDCF